MFMWLLRSFFYLYLILFSLFVSPFYSAPIDIVSSFNEVLQVIFVTWPIFILLTLLYVLGVHKTHSLRSVEQPPLMQEVESQAATADAEPIFTQSATTPMTENTPTEISVTEASHNPFPWDGLSDAPPRYTPAETRQPSLRTTTELPATEASQQQSASSSQYPPTQTQTTQTQSLAAQSDSVDAPHPSDSSAPSEPEESRQGPEQHAAAVAGPVSSGQPSQYIADAQVPEMSAEPPSHDEAMGLYHQADGMMPRSETIPHDEKK